MRPRDETPRRVDGPLEARSLGERGLEAAIERADAEHADAESIAMSLVEALWWIAALDDWHEEAYTPGHGQRYYFDHLRVGDQGEAVAGLVWARNLIGHELVNATTLFDVVLTWDGEPLTWGGELLMWGEPSWHQRTELPEPRTKEKWGRDLLYDKNVAGRRFDEPIKAALDFFRTVPDPPTAMSHDRRTLGDEQQ